MAIISSFGYRGKKSFRTAICHLYFTICTNGNEHPSKLKNKTKCTTTSCWLPSMWNRVKSSTTSFSIVAFWFHILNSAGSNSAAEFLILFFVCCLCSPWTCWYVCIYLCNHCLFTQTHVRVSLSFPTLFTWLIILFIGEDQIAEEGAR